MNISFVELFTPGKNLTSITNSYTTISLSLSGCLRMLRGTFDPTPPRRVSRQRRDYIPLIRFLKAIPPFQDLICFSLFRASSRV